MLKLRENQFCALVRSAEWQAWLGEHAPDVLKDLRSFLIGGQGCRANREKMLAVREELYRKDLGQKFEQFITHRFPLLVVRDEPPQPAQKQISRQNTHPSVPIPLSSRNPKLNKHGVFKIYRPEMLSFPHKLIIQNENRAELEEQVREFSQRMIGVSFVIIEDTAYIEYLQPKFADVLAKLPDHLYETKAYLKRKT